MEEKGVQNKGGGEMNKEETGQTIGEFLAYHDGCIHGAMQFVAVFGVIIYVGVMVAIGIVLYL